MATAPRTYTVRLLRNVNLNREHWPAGYVSPFSIPKVEAGTIVPDLPARMVKNMVNSEQAEIVVDDIPDEE